MDPAAQLPKHASSESLSLKTHEVEISKDEPLKTLTHATARQSFATQNALKEASDSNPRPLSLITLAESLPSENEAAARRIRLPSRFRKQEAVPSAIPAANLDEAVAAISRESSRKADSAPCLKNSLVESVVVESGHLDSLNFAIKAGGVKFVTFIEGKPVFELVEQRHLEHEEIILLHEETKIVWTLGLSEEKHQLIRSNPSFIKFRLVEISREDWMVCKNFLKNMLSNTVNQDHREDRGSVQVLQNGPVSIKQSQKKTKEKLKQSDGKEKKQKFLDAEKLSITKEEERAVQKYHLQQYIENEIEENKIQQGKNEIKKRIRQEGQKYQILGYDLQKNRQHREDSEDSEGI